MSSQNIQIILKNELFYLEHLLAREDILSELKRNFAVFRESGKGLEYYLKETAVRDEKNNENRTYLVRDNLTEEIVGYYSLKAGLFF